MLKKYASQGVVRILFSFLQQNELENCFCTILSVALLLCVPKGLEHSPIELARIMPNLILKNEATTPVGLFPAGVFILGGRLSWQLHAR